MGLDDATLERLLNMEEGPTLDFKRGQYPFVGASERDKSELLKDILAFTNSQRDDTAFILLGVEEVKGERSRVVGVGHHLEDADLHKFVSNKANRPVEFRYSQCRYEGKEIGALVIPIQDRPVYARRRYGIVQPDTVYLRDGSSTRSASPDEIVAMGRNNPPKLVEWSINRLENVAKDAVLTATQQWWEHPFRADKYGPQEEVMSYEEACERLLDRPRLPTDYPKGIDSYESLHWVFRRFDDLASRCDETMRTVGPALIEEFGALIRAMETMKAIVTSEKQVWEEFRKRTDSTLSPLPAEAGYNLLVIAALTVRFVEVIYDKDLLSDPDHDSLSRYPLPIRWHSDQWGDWRS